MGKILIVDDSKPIRQQVKFVLNKSGYEVVEAVNGVEGLEALKTNDDIQMCISDVNMPEMDGLTMLENAVKITEIPIIMLTTEGSGEAIQRARDAGAKGWLVKPFKPPELIGVVKKFVG